MGGRTPPALLSAADPRKIKVVWGSPYADILQKIGASISRYRSLILSLQTLPQFAILADGLPATLGNGAEVCFAPFQDFCRRSLACRNRTWRNGRVCPGPQAEIRIRLLFSLLPRSAG